MQSTDETGDAAQAQMPPTLNALSISARGSELHCTVSARWYAGSSMKGERMWSWKGSINRIC